MRFLSLLFLTFFVSPVMSSQNSDFPSVWLTDDFSGEALSETWLKVSGNWSLSDGSLLAGGAGEQLCIMNSLYLMRTKPYVVEGRVRGMGGLVFCMEDVSSLVDGHAVFFTGNTISTGYFDFQGRYVETRVVDYVLPSTEVAVRVHVNPSRKTYSLFVEDNDVLLEELRFISGYMGLYAEKPGVRFHSVTVRGEGQPDPPSYYRKSQERQLDHLSYMTLFDESLFISNPVVGIVQRITSVGSFVYELQLRGGKTEPRGVAVDGKHIYVVDGAQQSLRMFDINANIERSFSSGLNDPRSVAVAGGKVFVLDKSGIQVFDTSGAALGTKASGQFKDGKNLFVHGGNIYVADFGNGRVAVLDGKDFSERMSIKEHLVSPWDVCVDDANGDIYVADPGVVAVFRYDKKGTFLERIEPITIKGFISPRAVRVRGTMIYVGDFERILGFKKGVLSIRPSLRID